MVAPTSYSILTFFDSILIVTLLLLAWKLLSSEDIFTAVILFISFGLLMALAWVRMRAPDVALAEAAQTDVHVLPLTTCTPSTYQISCTHAPARCLGTASWKWRVLKSGPGPVLALRTCHQPRLKLA